MSSGNDNSGIDPNAWMATFADLLMLLLTFFVLLLSMKSMDSGKVRAIFMRTYGPLDFISQNEFVPPLDEFTQYTKAQEITSTEALEDVMDMLEGVAPVTGGSEGIRTLRELIDVTDSDQGVVVTLGADHLFASGDAEIHPDRVELLDTIASIFRRASNDILIMGHTDSVPVGNGPYGSNWELSVYRALSVFYYLTDAAGLDASRLAAGGYGDRIPLVPNDSEVNRAKNRRVEFVLKRD